MKLENLLSEIQQYYKKTKPLVLDYLAKTKAKTRDTLHKINEYIKEDYGIDFSKVGEVIDKITSSKIFITIMIIILTPTIGVLFAGSLLVMAIWSIYLFAIYLCLVIMTLIYVLLRDKLDEKYQII